MKLRKCFEFSGEEPFFQGHFPEVPVLPGVMQVELAHKAAEEMLGETLTLKAVKKMKFVRIIHPKMPVELLLEGDCASGVSYRFMKGDELCSSGVLTY